MDYTIVYKTYKNDLEWLYYSLLSIVKYFDDIPEIVIYYHSECEIELNNLLSKFNLNFRIIPVEYDIHGYLKQMVIKCDCFKDIHTEYIMFMDCDVIFGSNFNPENLIVDDKIQWFYLEKNDNNKIDLVWSVWEKSIKGMIGIEMNKYYMYNGFPFLLKRESLYDAHDMFIKMNSFDYNDFCKNKLETFGISVDDSLTGPDGKFPILATIFEEFEYLGWFCENHSQNYNFIEGPNYLINGRLQFWSHGGLTDEVKNKIEDLLN